MAGQDDIDHPIRSSDFYLGRRRDARAAPLLLGALSKYFLTQTVAITAPYLVSQAERVFQRLAAKSTLQFKAHLQRKSNNSFQQQLDEALRDSPANFFNLQIPMQSLNFDPRIDQSLPTLQADNCAKAALSQDNTPLQKICNSTVFSAQIISEIFSLQDGKLYLFLGKSTLFLSCYILSVLHKWRM